MFKQGLIVAIFIPILLLFHNCGKFSAISSKGGFNAALGCVDEIKPVFKSSMHTFFRSHKCVECHAEGGEAKGKYFAHSNVDTAFQVFLAFGSDSIKRRVDAGHNYDPKDTDVIKADLSKAKSEWDNALSNLDCGNTGVKTSAKSIPFLNGTSEPDAEGKTHPIVANANEINPVYKIVIKPPNDVPRELSWDLPTGITIQMHIQVQIDIFGNISYYLVNDLKAKANRPVTIKKIKVFLNDDTYSVTTFESVNKLLVGNGTFETLYKGASAVFQKSGAVDANQELIDPYTNSDAWTLSFEITEPEN